jgi:hypothetical protein
VDPEKLGVTRREAVAVHWLHHSLYDVTGSDSNTLCLIQRLACCYFHVKSYLSLLLLPPSTIMTTFHSILKTPFTIF